MVNISSKQRHSLAFRGLCLFMAGLTGCSTARSSYARNNSIGLNKTTARAETIQVVDYWGAKEQDSTLKDPEIAPGFLLTLRCAADSRMDGDYQVDFNGSMKLPYDLKINTTGLTLSQLHKNIVDQLRPYFKAPSEIDVTVKERRYWIDVRGLVQKPSRYLVESETSLDEVIGLAGGFSREMPPLYARIQKGAKVLVINLNQYYSQAFERSQILGWIGGEEVFFQKEIGPGTEERPSSTIYQQPVHILGEVKKPGDYPLTSGSDFVDTIVQAGGFTERADVEQIELIRKTPTGKRNYVLSWKHLSDAPAPEQGDIVIVRADSTTHSERRLTLFATLVSVAASIVTATILVLSYNKGRF